MAMKIAGVTEKSSVRVVSRAASVKVPVPVRVNEGLLLLAKSRLTWKEYETSSEPSSDWKSVVECR